MELETVGCIVMAAGTSSRFGGDKLAARLDGKTLLRRALEAVPGGRCSAVVVVTQRPEGLALARTMGFTPVVNDRPEDGLSRTIRLGLEAVGPCDGALFLVADQPLLTRESVERLIDAWQANPNAIAALSHDGVRGNPCLFPARLFPELLALEGDHGGSTVIRHHQTELTLVDAAEVELSDVDDRAALEALRQEKD